MNDATNLPLPKRESQPSLSPSPLTGEGRGEGEAAATAAQSLLQNLPLLTTAPNGIQKLRELILELAVRGKLVPQDPNDEPASELLKRIDEEKSKLEAQGKIKRQKQQSEISPDEMPFDLPKGWEWVRVASVGHDWGQKTPDQPFTYIDVGSIDNAAGLIRSPQVVAPEDAPSRARKVVMAGTVIYSTIRPYLLNIAVVDEDYAKEPIASTAFAIIHPYLSMPARYFLWYLRSPTFIRYVESVQTGIAYPAINDGQFFSGLVPLPPMAEQHRIVAKVDELMALCDRLEAQQGDAAQAHEQLVKALLDALVQAATHAPADTRRTSDTKPGADAQASHYGFTAAWNRLAEHFDILFTTEASIDALKQTLLQLAVMGKLVPQDPDDEPAGELLNRIYEEKERLVREGKIRQKKSVPKVGDAKGISGLPPSWEWVNLSDVGLTSTGGTPSTGNSQFFGGDLPFIGPGQITDAGEILASEKWLTQIARSETTVAEPGDILMVCIGGTIGKSAIADRVLAFNQQINSVRVLIASSKFIFIAISTPEFQNLIRSTATGSATPIINRTKWEQLPVPLPPLTEQHRIVAKVDELMAICDQLKSRLNQSRQIHEHLANALVEQAVA